ncbi:MAG: ABC transporter permease [Ktedonobacteraceae bacterium]
MSTLMPSAAAEQIHLPAKPSFIGMVRGELFKVSRLWITWIMAVLLLGVMTLPYLVMLTVPGAKDAINQGPEHYLTVRMESNLAVLRAFAGIYLLIITAYIIGQEYQLGTIRILLARGVGRLQLLGAKVLAAVIIGLILLVLGLLYNVLLMSGLLAILTGDLHAYNALSSTFWSNTWLYLLSVLISMGVTILLAVGVSVLGRSLAIGLSVSVSWFAIDNMGVLMMLFANRLTHNDFWLNVTAYLLGPNLNAMPGALLGTKEFFSVGIPPQVDVDATHTLLVTLVYALLFAITAVVLTWQRDVKE